MLVKRRGQVMSGFGLAAGFVTHHSPEIAQHLGAAPHPGTLNVLLSRPLLLDHGSAIPLRSSELIRRQGFWPARFSGEPCLLMRVAWCPLHVVEILSPRPLRADFGLAQGSAVEIEMEDAIVQPLSLRNLIAWSILWLPNRRGHMDVGYIDTLHARNPRAFELAGQPVRNIG